MKLYKHEKYVVDSDNMCCKAQLSEVAKSI